MFRPGLIQPVYGARSKTAWYRAFYTATSPVLSLARRVFPNYLLTTEDVGIAMLNAARRGAPKAVLESPDIRVLATG
jgi:hypothetical protein